MKRFVADFETRNSKNDIKAFKTSVWLWDVCYIIPDENDVYTHHYGRDIESFVKHIKNNPGDYYFHNLKFDFTFLLDYLLKQHREVGEKIDTIIDDMGSVYCIELKLIKSKTKFSRIKIFDSLKKVPGTVEDIAENLKLPISKLSIDHDKVRDEDYEATEEEIKYAQNDTEIVARILRKMFEEGHTKMTQGSDAFDAYKRHLDDNHKTKEKTFRKIFPLFGNKTHEYDSNWRDSYRGGMTIINKRYANIILNNVKVYDVNSMYPAIMHNEKLPYGIPEEFSGKPDENKDFIINVDVILSLKKNHVPCILDSNSLFGKKIYIIKEEEFKNLTLTSVDYKLMFEQYDVSEIQFNNGWYFKTTTENFSDYIDTLYKLKQTSDGVQKQIYKILLNSLYGKFGTNPERKSKKIELIDNCLTYVTSGTEIIDPVYVPLACFVTAYGRRYLVDAIQNNYENFVYSDTDSVHLVNLVEPKGMKIDDNELGAWAHEKTYTRAKYLGPKTYMGFYDKSGETKKEVKCAGMPSNVKKKVTFKNFRFGSEFKGKKRQMIVEGGTLLVPSKFTIKDNR